MLSTFLAELKSCIRDKSGVFWTLAFPVILAALMMGMLNGIENNYQIDAQPFAIVADSHWEAAAGAQQLADAVSGKAESSKQNTKLIVPKTVSNRSQAGSELRSSRAIGYLYASDDARLHMVISSQVASKAQADPTSTTGITISVLSSALSQYNQTGSAIAAIAKADPHKLADRNFVAQIEDASSQTYTRSISLTHFKPTMTAPYYFAVLGMACMISVSTAIMLIARSQPNLSDLGLRRSISPLPKWRQLAATFATAWLFSGISLVVAYAFIRIVCHVDIGGRDLPALAAIAVASFMATAFGMLLGALPNLSAGSKAGIDVFLTLALSAFAGLYGPSLMELSYSIQEKAPILHLLNPVKQVSNLFYDIIYYDSFRPFLRTVGVLVAMSAIFLLGSLALLRRQRYEHL